MVSFYNHLSFYCNGVDDVRKCYENCNQKKIDGEKKSHGKFRAKINPEEKKNQRKIMQQRKDKNKKIIQHRKLPRALV